MDLNAFSNPMEIGAGADPSTGSTMNADALWKRFDEPAMASQLAMFPFGSQTSSSAGPNVGGAGHISAESASGALDDAPKDKSSKRSSAAKSETASKSSAKASKKARASLTEAEKVARREKHNQVEIRRRKRINQRFSELGDICGCDSKQKRNILTSAIDKLKEYEDRIQQLKSNLESLALDDNPDSADADEKQDDMQYQQDLSVVDHRSVFMKSGVPLHVSGFDGRILDCNEKFAQLFGFTREVILANQVTVFSLTAPDSLAVTFGVVGHLMKGNPRAQVDNLMIGPGGRLIKVKVTAWLIRDNGRPKYFMSMMVPDPNFQSPMGNAASSAPLAIQPSAHSASNSMTSFMPQSSGNPAAMAQMSAQQSLQMGSQLPSMQMPVGSMPPTNMIRGQSTEFNVQPQTQLQQQQQQQLLLQQLLMQQAKGVAAQSQVARK